MTDGMKIFLAQQKQCKKIILTDSKDIFTYLYNAIQCLQPIFMTDSRRTFINTE